MEIAKIGVIGTGIGTGIAQVAAETGFDVVLKSRCDETLENSIKKIRGRLLRSKEEKSADYIISKILPTTGYEDLAECDLIIEAIVEDKKAKIRMFRDLDGICGGKTVFASNTSSLSIEGLSLATGRRDRFLGVHFFNPPHRMELVEIVKTGDLDPEILEKVIQTVKSMGKTPVITDDTPCFIVNRILMPLLNEAVLAYEEGGIKAEDIDKAARTGLNHPMGPLALLDLIGLDVFVSIMDNMHERTKNEKYRPAKLAVEMVGEGKLGRKTKRGFYEY